MLQNWVVAYCFFFFNDTATTEIYPLSLHDALPIFDLDHGAVDHVHVRRGEHHDQVRHFLRSEEHTSELQSHVNLVCRLLLDKNDHYRDAHGEDQSHLAALAERISAWTE